MRVLADEAIDEKISNFNPIAQKVILRYWESHADKLFSKISTEISQSEPEVEPEAEPEVEPVPEAEPVIKSNKKIFSSDNLDLQLIKEKMSFAKLFREREDVITEYSRYYPKNKSKRTRLCLTVR